MPATPSPAKTRIVREIKAALSGITGIAALVDVDAAALEQGGRSEDWTQIIRSAIESGQYAIELDVGASEPVVEGDSSASGQNVTGVDMFEFAVAALVHLPKVLPDDPDDPGTKLTPLETAERKVAEIYAIAATFSPGEGQTQCGQWLELTSGNRTGAPLALYSEVGPMGGVALSDIGTRVSLAGFTVRHRVAQGDMTLVA